MASPRVVPSVSCRPFISTRCPHRDISENDPCQVAERMKGLGIVLVRLLFSSSVPLTDRRYSTLSLVNLV